MGTEDEPTMGWVAPGQSWVDEAQTKFGDGLKAMKEWSASFDMAIRDIDALRDFLDSPVRGRTPGGLVYRIRPSVLGEFRG